jgi:hypothetical protein
MSEKLEEIAFSREWVEKHVPTKTNTKCSNKRTVGHNVFYAVRVTCLQNSHTVGQENAVISCMGSGLKTDCAGEGHQT